MFNNLLNNFLTTCKVYSLLAISLGGLSFISTNLSANDTQLDIPTSSLEYKSASKYSHLKWYSLLDIPIKVSVLPIQNYSGVPIKTKQKDANNFDHSEIPASVALLFSDLANSSRYLEVDNKNNDFHFQLSIEEYKLPYDFKPEGGWVDELNGKIDRWFVSPKSSQVKLSLKITGKTPMKPWVHSVSAVLDTCDLNSLPQPLTSISNNNKILVDYVKTSPGQAFIAASNYLILQGIKHIKQKHTLAQITGKYDNELFLTAKNNLFTSGEKLNIYYQNAYPNRFDMPAGEVQVIKAYSNQAVAYPTTLRSDQIKKGDWVELRNHTPVQLPRSKFIPKNQCAEVEVAIL